MKKQRFLFIALAIIILSVLIYCSIQIGVLGRTTIDSDIAIISRLPRTFAIILTGMGISISGLIMQIIVHNHFVEPNTTGTAQGASIGILIALLFFPHWSIFFKMGLSSLTALITMLFFIKISRRLSFKDPLLLPLVGLIYASILSAIILFIAYQTDLVQALQVIINGDFSAILQGRFEWLWGCLGLSVLLYILADKLTIVGMGEHGAQALGLDYRKLVLISIACISVMTAFVISTVGMIAFLGLIVPNITRRFLGDNLKIALPWVAWMGAVLLLICDIIARLVIFPYEVPVSLIFGIIGTIIFIYLLLRPIQYG